MLRESQGPRAASLGNRNESKDPMQIQLIELVRSVAALVAGTLVGIGFGIVQNNALRRYEARQRTGSLTTGWAVMPGSMRRVAGLLIALALVQMFCPLLFVEDSQWWVSGGVVAGYGVMLYRQFRQRQFRGSL
jgi:hypothetical protein